MIGYNWHPIPLGVIDPRSQKQYVKEETKIPNTKIT